MKQYFIVDGVQIEKSELPGEFTCASLLPGGVNGTTIHYTGNKLHFVNDEKLTSTWDEMDHDNLKRTCKIYNLEFRRKGA